MGTSETTYVGFEGFCNHVRKRPGMYLGALNAYGFAENIGQVISELFDLSGRSGGGVWVRIERSGSFELRVDQSLDFSWMERWVGGSAEVSTDRFLFNGIMTAISQRVDWKWTGEGKVRRLAVEEAQVAEPDLDWDPDPGSGFAFRCLPSGLFGHPYDWDLLEQKLRDLALVNPGMEIVLRDERRPHIEQRYFHFPNGIFDLEEKKYLSYFKTATILRLHEKVGENEYRILVREKHRFGWEEVAHLSFCNDFRLKLPGSLLRGIKYGLVRAHGKKTWKFSENKGPGKLNFNHIDERLEIVATIRTPDPTFEGCTKWRLGMPEVEKEVRDLVVQTLQEQKEASAFSVAIPQL